MKQCDFDVIQLVNGNTGFYDDYPDLRVKRIDWAAAFAKWSGMAGINTLVQDMLENPGKTNCHAECNT